MYKFKVDIDVKDYQSFYKGHSKAVIMQDDNWRRVKSNWGSTICGMYKDDNLVATALILIKRLPFNISLFYVPGGYLIDYSNEKLLREFTTHIKKFAKSKSAYVIKMNPYIVLKEKRWHQLGNEKYEIFSKNNEIMTKNLKETGYLHKGYKKEIGAYFQPRFTMVVPLVDPNENFLSKDMLLRTFKKNVRSYLGDYHSKRGVFFSHSNDINDITEFATIINKTEVRKKVSLRSEAYFRRMMKAFGENAVLFFGKIDLNKYLEFIEESLDKKNSNKDFLLRQKEDVIKIIEERGNIVTLSASLVIFPANEEGIRIAEFLYAGNDVGILPNLKVNNGLTYYRLLYCLENKYHFANLGGVDGSLTDNLSVFKSKFNPLVIEFIGEYDFPVNKILYALISFFEPLLKKGFNLIRGFLKK